jgi:3-oxoacyl-[acyl-carrier-protein] synthase-1
VSAESVGLPAVGLVCALGAGHDAVWPRLVAGDDSGVAFRSDLAAGSALRFGSVASPLPETPRAVVHHDTRAARLALGAFAQIESAARAAVARYGALRVGVVVGTSTGGIGETEAAFRGRGADGALLPGAQLTRLEFGGVAEVVAHAAGAAGPRAAMSTACSSGAKALASARQWIAAGFCDAVIAGGADALCGMTANGFRSLQALAADRTNPMSARRDGLVLGEGAALFLVTREPAPLGLLGTGEAMDAHHISAPHPEGVGAEAAMRAALADAGLEPSDIAYLNLHGTGTPQNDVMESRAVARVFAAPPPCSSTKPLTGHTLAAAGALEAAFTWLALARRDGARMALPPHLWDGVRDPALPALPLAQRGDICAAPRPAAAMSTSFGFGGSNCALILGDTR